MAGRRVFSRTRALFQAGLNVCYNGHEGIAAHTVAGLLFAQGLCRRSAGRQIAERPRTGPERAGPGIPRTRLSGMCRPKAAQARARVAEVPFGRTLRFQGRRFWQARKTCALQSRGQDD